MNIKQIAMASALALATAAPAFAQSYEQPAASAGQAQQGTPFRPTPEYQAAQQQYQQQSQQYEDSQRAYYRSRADYREARAAYEHRLADWQASRIAYDAKYGTGAYARIYPAPVWDESRWTVVTVSPSAESHGTNTTTVIHTH